MIKYLLIILISLSIVGCDAYISGEEIKQAEKICEDHGGIAGLFVAGFDDVSCKDGLYASVKELEPISDKK